ncbi:MAG TPA: hypothetical protein VK524_07415 [Polyangiaceae bacterium]|nr:hypothetical protein [Polyangiaceae bacterium]
MFKNRLMHAASAGASVIAASALLFGCASADGSDVSAEQASEESSSSPLSIGLLRCGGFTGTPCPSGFTCVDDPRDDCSPCRGGADCGGICVETTCRKPTCDPKLSCAQVLTCVGGQLYPTACGPKNCDRPLGPCDRTTAE